MEFGDYDFAMLNKLHNRQFSPRLFLPIGVQDMEDHYNGFSTCPPREVCDQKCFSPFNVRKSTQFKTWHMLILIGNNRKKFKLEECDIFAPAELLFSILF